MMFCSVLFFFEGRYSKFGVWMHLGIGSVAYHFRVTVTLTVTSDLVFRIIVFGAYLSNYLR